MGQDYKINKIEIYKEKINEYISIDVEQYFQYSYKDNGNLNDYKYNGNSFPIYFLINDNIHFENELSCIRNENINNELSSIELVNDDNVIIQYITPQYYTTQYRVLVDLKRFSHIKKKILSENYKKFFNVSEDSKYIIINLIYTPNIRRIKLNKIKDRIKQNNEL